MDETTFTIEQQRRRAGLRLPLAGEGDPKAVVQIAHGMGEHAARYRRLGEALVDAGYVVYANDHRGHGRTAGIADRHGDLGTAGWSGLIDDMAALTARARAEHPGIPLVLLGHSMGSFALQQYLLDRSADIDAAVLSGTSAVDVIAGRHRHDPAGRPDGVQRAVRAGAHRVRLAQPRRGRGRRVRRRSGVRLRRRRRRDDGDARRQRAALADAERLAAIRDDLPLYIFSGDADPLAGGGRADRDGRRPLSRRPGSTTSRSRSTRAPATRRSTRPTATRSPPTSSPGSTA